MYSLINVETAEGFKTNDGKDRIGSLDDQSMMRKSNLQFKMGTFNILNAENEVSVKSSVSSIKQGSTNEKSNPIRDSCSNKPSTTAVERQMLILNEPSPNKGSPMHHHRPMSQDVHSNTKD